MRSMTKHWSLSRLLKLEANGAAGGDPDQKFYNLLSEWQIFSPSSNVTESSN